MFSENNKWFKSVEVAKSSLNKKKKKKALIQRKIEPQFKAQNTPKISIRVEAWHMAPVALDFPYRCRFVATKSRVLLFVSA
jgi:hypothetical protein